MTDGANTGQAQRLARTATDGRGIPATRDRRSSGRAGVVAGYGREHQLLPYAVLFGTYASLTTAGVLSALLRRRRIAPATIADGALLSAAGFKLSRLVTKDKVTGFVRAPFTQWVEEGDGAEVNERPRGDGVRYAIGELLTCPFCCTQWTTTALGVAWLHSPKATRALMTLLTASAAADVLHVAWTRIEALG